MGEWERRRVGVHLVCRLRGTDLCRWVDVDARGDPMPTYLALNLQVRWVACCCRCRVHVMHMQMQVRNANARRRGYDW